MALTQLLSVALPTHRSTPLRTPCPLWHQGFGEGACGDGFRRALSGRKDLCGSLRAAEGCMLRVPGKCKGLGEEASEHAASASAGLTGAVGPPGCFFPSSSPFGWPVGAHSRPSAPSRVCSVPRPEELVALSFSRRAPPLEPRRRWTLLQPRAAARLVRVPGFPWLPLPQTSGFF